MGNLQIESSIKGAIIPKPNNGRPILSQPNTGGDDQQVLRASAMIDFYGIYFAIDALDEGGTNFRLGHEQSNLEPFGPSRTRRQMAFTSIVAEAFSRIRHSDEADEYALSPHRGGRPFEGRAEPKTLSNLFTVEQKPRAASKRQEISDFFIPLDVCKGLSTDDL